MRKGGKIDTNNSQSKKLIDELLLKITYEALKKMATTVQKLPPLIELFTTRDSHYSLPFSHRILCAIQWFYQVIKDGFTARAYIHRRHHARHNVKLRAYIIF